MADTSDNLKAFFQDDGKALIVPIDHGHAIPVPGLEKPAELIGSLAPQADGWVACFGLARDFREHFAGKGVCMRTDVYKPDNPLGSFGAFGVEEAMACGASAMMHMLYPGHENEAAIIRECAETIREGDAVGLPVIVESLPMGLGMPDEYTVEKVSFAVRMAAELGAHVVKTTYPTGASVEEFKAIIDACWVPVVVLGGAAMGDDRALLAMVHDAMSAGAAGIAIGRNVWQHPDPPKIAAALQAVVHGGADVGAALEAGGLA